MAEEGSTTKKNTAEDLVFVLFFLFVLANMLNRIPIFLEEKFGIELGGSQLGLAAASLDGNTPLGTRVSLVNGASYFKTPGGPEQGFFAAGREMELADGPRQLGFKRYWYVRDPVTDEGGWVSEADLVRTDVNNIDASTPLGTRVRAILDTILWQSSAVETQVGQMRKDMTGTLRDGPTQVRGARWWFVDVDDTQTDGWVPESAMTLSTTEGFRIGMAVRAVHNTDLFERAGGGAVLAFMQEDDQGRITAGPERVGGVFWWQVTTNSGNVGWVAESTLARGGTVGWFRSVLFVFVIVATTLTVVLLVGLVYVTLRTNQIRAKEARRIKNAIPKTIEVLKNERWEQILANVSSENPNDWRLGIIEADIMLDELITRLGYHGATLGEKLKQVARGDMQSLDSAWEAHKTRNQIAHAGSDFILSQREARRVIELYGEVFREFRFI